MGIVTRNVPSAHLVPSPPLFPYVYMYGDPIKRTHSLPHSHPLIPHHHYPNSNPLLSPRPPPPLPIKRNKIKRKNTQCYLHPLTAHGCCHGNMYVSSSLHKPLPSWNPHNSKNLRPHVFFSEIELSDIGHTHLQ